MTDLTASQIQAAITEEADDEFKDAVEEENEEADADGNFPVTPEELAIIRAELASDFPEDYNYLSDSYILSVASKPYSKDPTVRRPLEVGTYRACSRRMISLHLVIKLTHALMISLFSRFLDQYSMEKLGHVMNWRAEEGAPDMLELVKMANGPATAPEAVENPEKLTKAKAMATSLNYASMYWHGMTKDGRPILWLRTNRKPWYPDVDAEVNALIAMADAGIKCMPEGITDFICISDSSSPPPPNPTFMIKMLKALVRGYPDRLNMLMSAPVSSIVQFVMNLLLPLMPGRLASKVVLLDLEGIKPRLKDMLMHGEEDIPKFFGGPSDHDKFYPEEYYSENRGQGNLKFDFFGMIERLEASKKEFEASKNK